MTPVGSFVVAPEHPCLAGHFPGSPVVPGVVLLDRALTALLGGPGHRPAAVPAVKFLRPVLPGQSVVVSCADVRNGRLAFECSVSGTVVARGSVTLG